MTLQYIEINNLTISPLNVRKYGAKDCEDLVASIRALGVLQPLLVRPFDGSFEVIAGQRRLNACRILAEETVIKAIPCLVMAEGDDATAIEASLAENIERQPMDEVDQYKAFAKLIKEGRELAEIAATFAITERMVEQRLALGRLHAPILTAYRKGDIHARDIRNLTMATTKQQKAWWALIKDEDAYAPTGTRLKDWLFGGAHIPIAHALFDVDAPGLAVVSDLFGEDSYFADAEAFWAQQNTVIAEAVETYQQGGWAQVTVLETGTYFARWDHRKCPKKDGGHVFVELSTQGEVTFHEGYVTAKEAKRREKAETGTAPFPKPELTKAAQNYVDLHRHAAVRADLLNHTNLSLRLVVAHMLVGSDLWIVRDALQNAAKPAIAESLRNSTAQKRFEAEREMVAQLLGFTHATHLDGFLTLEDVFERLIEMSDDDVGRVMTYLMAESLSVQSPLIDGLAGMMGTDMAHHWQPEDTFFDLVRDKQVLNAMIGEVAGETVAKANLPETAKTQRKILRDCINGTRTPVDASWMPRYMAFPQGSYTAPTTQKDAECDEHRPLAHQDAA